MAQLGEAERPQRTWVRVSVAVFIGLVCCAVIWIGAPLADFVVLHGVSVVGSYLPVIVISLLLLVVLLVNPVLRLFSRAAALNRTQLAIILGMMLVASTIPGQGLLRMLPYSLVYIPLDTSQDPTLADTYEKAGLPEGLFPAKLGQDEPPPAADDFVDKLGEGAQIPWDAWLQPLLYWGTFLLFAWLMMIAMAQIVLPQWRKNELLPFPLVAVQETLIETPEKGHLWAPIFRRPSFWVAALGVFVLYLLTGLNQYYPKQVPAVPLEWDIGGLFAGDLLRVAPWYVKQGHLYFIFVGVAFFMPSRIGFSVWFFQILYAVYVVARYRFFPASPVVGGSMTEPRMGAMFAVAAVVLWLGRAHWVRVFGSLFRKAEDDEDHRSRKAATMFIVGCLGMWGWLWHVGCGPLWAFFFVAFACTVCLIITRIVAETGMVFIRLHFYYDIAWIKTLPLKFLSLPVLLFATVIATLFAMGSRISATTMATHALALDRDATPSRQWRFGMLCVLLLAVGLVVSGATHLWANYHYDQTLDGQYKPLGAEGYVFPRAHGDMKAFFNQTKQAEAFDEKVAKRGTGGEQAPTAETGPAAVEKKEEEVSPRDKPLREYKYSKRGYLVFGAALAGVLEWLCLKTPLWPVHPIGLLMVDTYYGWICWWSVFAGWLAKVLILRYGGARLYRAAKTFFLGLIIGEVFAGAFWCLEPTVRALLDLTYKVVQVQPH